MISILAGLMGTGALEAQILALESAARASEHPNVWCVAPHVENFEDASKMCKLLHHTHPGIMLESVSSFKSAGLLGTMAKGIWVGLGDLSEELQRPEMEALLRDFDSRQSVPTFLCGPHFSNDLPKLIH